MERRGESWRRDCMLRGFEKRGSTMRSLTWRWIVAIVVGSLWGALVAPARPSNTVGKRPSPEAAADAAHYRPSNTKLTALALRIVNAPGF